MVVKYPGKKLFWRGRILPSAKDEVMNYKFRQNLKLTHKRFNMCLDQTDKIIEHLFVDNIWYQHSFKEDF